MAISLNAFSVQFTSVPGLPAASFTVSRGYAAPVDKGNKTMAIAPIVARERKGVALAIRW